MKVTVQEARAFSGPVRYPSVPREQETSAQITLPQEVFSTFQGTVLKYYLFTGCVLFVFHVFLCCCDSFWIFFLALVFPAGDKRVTVASFLYRDLGDLLPKRATGAKK